MFLRDIAISWIIELLTCDLYIVLYFTDKDDSRNNKIEQNIFFSDVLRKSRSHNVRQMLHETWLSERSELSFYKSYQNNPIESDDDGLLMLYQKVI